MQFVALVELGSKEQDLKHSKDCSDAVLFVYGAPPPSLQIPKAYPFILINEMPEKVVFFSTLAKNDALRCYF